MGKSLIWRWLIIIIVVAVWGASIWPPTDRDYFDTMRKEARGVDDQFEKVVERAAAIIDESVQSRSKVTVSPMNAVDQAASELNVNLRNYITVYGMDEPSNQEVLNYVRRVARGKLRLGLDLSGGTEFVVAFNEDDVPDGERASDIQQQLMEIIRNRIDNSGVLEPEIVPYGATGISVKIPTIDEEDTNRFREILTRQAVLRFRLVHEENERLAAEEAAERQESPGFILNEMGYQRFVHASESRGRADREVLWLSTEDPGVSGEHITNAYPTMGEFGGYQIAFEMGGEGAIAFGELTGNNVGRRMAIILDETVYSAPVINSRIGGGRGVITGSFRQEEAAQLAIVLKSGNLPVKTSIEGINMTAPTLGLESIRSGTMAAVAGIIVVILFMTIYYFRCGLIANIALFLNMVLVMGTLPIIDATITLPGLAGIILTIGMAVDANVLIFERIREELKTGKSIRNAISRGYASAFSTILDANLTTLFTAIILMKFGSGPIKGFGVTLSIGIIASMFTALFVTRAIFDALLHYDKIHKLRMLQILDQSRIPFLDYRKIAYLASAAMMVLALLTFAIRGTNALSVDFRGGTQLAFQYEEEVPSATIVDTLQKSGMAELRDVRATYKSSTRREGRLMEVVVSAQFDEKVNAGALIGGILNENFPQSKFSLASTELIGAMVGSQFTRQAIWAMFWSLFAIVIYISFRFEVSYAIGAVIALGHDVIIGAGIFLLWGFGERQISLTVIAALLTIIGYSLNDTIVVFDRIRENVGLLKKTKFTEICMISINQTLSRTILTSSTTLVVVIILYLFGGGAINDFALVMLIGILIGTYSSIFVATPVMIFFQKKLVHKRAVAASAAEASSKNVTA